MISQRFEGSGKKVTFDKFGVAFDDEKNGVCVWLSVVEFAELMPLAMHVYHQGQFANGGCAQSAPVAAKKKRGRPAKKVANAKPVRPRKA